MVQRLAWILVGVVSVTIPMDAAAQSDPLVLEVTTGLRQSLQAVKTLRASFVSRQLVPIATEEKGVYLRSGQTERVHQETVDGTRQDRLVRSGVVKTLFTVVQPTKNSTNQATVETIQDGYARTSAYSELLIHQNDSSGRVCSYEELLAASQGKQKTEKTKIKGRECVKITLAATDPMKNEVQTDFWHDIQAGYFVIKAEYRSNSNLVLVASVDEFDTSKPGISFPVKATYRFYDSKQNEYQAREFKLINVAINEPVAESELSLPTPPGGTYLNDRIKGVRGVMASNWSMVGPTEAIELTPLLPISGNAVGIVAGTATEREPRSLASILIVVSLLCGVGLMLVLFVRKYRAGGTTEST